jgi:hypothetical protein
VSVVTTTDTTPTNSTPQDDLGELDKLLVQRMIDGLKAEAPVASFLAVVERYLAARKAEMKPQAPKIAPGLTMPFPRSLEPVQPAAKADGAEAMHKALLVPFLADGKHNPDFRNG